MRLATGFSGIEGFGLAAQRCGIELVAMSETDRFCCKVLAHRFPGVPNLGDIREVTGDAIRAAAGGTVDVWAGGFPCQDVSVAGQRAGLDGDRTGLFWEFVRIAAEAQVLFEPESCGGDSASRREAGTAETRAEL